MNQISVNDLVIPICVSEYRKRNVLANMIKKRMEHPPSEYIEFLEDLAEDLHKQYEAPTESLDEKEYYENLINESIIHRNATAESQNKCSRYFNAICKIAISINDLIYKNAEIICKCLDDWMFYREFTTRRFICMRDVSCILFRSYSCRTNHNRNRINQKYTKRLRD